MSSSVKATGRTCLTWAAHLYCTAVSSGPPWSEWGHRPHPQSQRGRHCGWSVLCPGFWSRSSAPRQAGVCQHGSAQDRTLSPLQPSLPHPTPRPLCTLSPPPHCPPSHMSHRVGSGPAHASHPAPPRKRYGASGRDTEVEERPTSGLRQSQAFQTCPARCVTLEEASPLWVGVGWFVQDS